MPVYSVRTSTSSVPGRPSTSTRFSPFPGRVTQKARADGSVVSILPVELSLIRLYRQHHPHARFGAANYVTVVRGMLTLGLLWLATRQPSADLGFFAGVTAGV